LAVVCPGRSTALPATGRKWHRTSLSRARRNLVRPARPGQGGARASGRVLTATTARPRGGRSGNPDQAIISLGLRVLATKLAGTMDNLRVARFPGSLQRVRRKRQALSTPSPGEPSLKPACRYLSLRFQTIQSCSPVRYPITTAVQPWRAQECAYTFVLSPSLLPVALAACDARRTAVRIRFSAFTASARHGFVRFLFFFIEFAFLRGRRRRPCVKYRFNSYTSRGLTAACRLYIQNEGLREKFCPACNNR
jgi:hypothetical protein